MMVMQNFTKKNINSSISVSNLLNKIASEIIANAISIYYVDASGNFSIDDDLMENISDAEELISDTEKIQEIKSQSLTLLKQLSAKFNGMGLGFIPIINDFANRDFGTLFPETDRTTSSSSSKQEVKREDSQSTSSASTTPRISETKTHTKSRRSKRPRDINEEKSDEPGSPTTRQPRKKRARRYTKVESAASSSSSYPKPEDNKEIQQAIQDSILSNQSQPSAKTPTVSPLPTGARTATKDSSQSRE